MSALSTFLENRIADHILGNAPYTAPSNVFLALFQTIPTLTESGGGTELSGNGYARVQIANNSTNFPAASAGVKRNANPITFPVATGAWANAGHWAIFDSLTGGNMLFFGTIPTPISVVSGDQVIISANQLTLTFE